MPLSWNEIKKRSIEFSKEWATESRENAEAKSFWDGFFNVFGITRKRVASFEEPVSKLGNRRGFIDLFWKGTIIVEHKSRNSDLEKAYAQAIDYFPGITEYELPKYILVSDFNKFRLYDLEESKQYDFELKDLHKHIHLFGFIVGYRKRDYKEEDPVNIKAAELMGQFHDKLLEAGYKGHELEVFLVRILFCLFADDTGIFEKDNFKEYIQQKTNEDGSNLGPILALIFQILNTPETNRQATLDEDLKLFPYVNGKLFAEQLQVASFDSDMRKSLLKCCYFDWAKISPAVFGSLFQSVMDQDQRRNIGAHYTPEKSILKLIKPLFLDELHIEFEKVKISTNKLKEFQDKLASLNFLDPACGCGNFLVITYRELRLLELEILKILIAKEPQKYTDLGISFNINSLCKLDVDCMYGIETEEFPARIAEVAMWLIDHQMNVLISEVFGHYFVRLPLKKSANISINNALRINWEDIVKKENLSYILGNPPFVGKQHRNDSQNEDMDMVFSGVNGAGVLDYVTCWYIKAANYIQGTQIKAAFVSTNSISQGEQPGILWQELFYKYHIKIHFAHRTFKWESEAKGKASVHVVIIGFANYDIKDKLVFHYDTSKADPHEIKVSNINSYLVEGKDFVIQKRRKPICDVPLITFGSMPNDGGHFLLTDDEKEDLIKKEPEAANYIKYLVSSKEYLSGIKRWCLWLKDIAPSTLHRLTEISKRVEEIKKHRLSSDRITTTKLANFPTLFGEIRQPDSDYIFVPLTTSENRNYIPLDFLNKDCIANNTCSIIPNANNYHFGILMSHMHMTWVKYICGRMKSDYRYSNELVYNNYPWPENPISKNTKNVEELSKNVLEIRKEFTTSSLADLYDPVAMPPKLFKAHQELDKAVDLCYRSQPFPDDIRRIEFLFDLYNKYIQPLIGKDKSKKSTS